jgi:hypothetical protein
LSAQADISARAGEMTDKHMPAETTAPCNSLGKREIMIMEQRFIENPEVRPEDRADLFFIFS